MRFWKFEKSNLEEILENEITRKEKEDLDNLDSNNIDSVNNVDADQDNFSDNDNLSSNEDDSLFDNGDELEKDSNEISQSNGSSSSSSTSDSEDFSSEENTLDEKSDNSSNTDNSQENDSSDNSDELGTSSNETGENNNSSSTSSTSDSGDSSSKENTLDEKSNNSSSTGNSQENGESIDERKEKLQELRDKLDEYSKKKLNLERESLKPDEDISEESLEKDDYELSDQSNKFLEELSSLPSFKDRDRKDGYSIDTSKYSSIPDSLVRTLISKFLNQRFCKRDTDLNIRSNSFSKTHGFYKWEVKDMILHLETEQLNKVLEDKYGYQYANGASENVPLSFYFDMSGSMSEYTNMLAVIAIELLKKNVKVLIGFNERVNVQIDKIDKNITIDELVSVLESAGYSGYSYNNSDRFIRNSKVTYKFINRDIDDYLLSKECEKCVVFSDFDPLSEVIGLSQKAKVYWFCFENYFTKYDLGRFKGFIYQTNSAEDIINGLIKVNENRFETLCFVSNNKTLQRRK